MDDLVLIGGGGHARSVADSIEAGGKFHIVGYTDYINDACDLPYLGTDDELKRIYDKGVHKAAICVGYLGKSLVRDKLYNVTKDIGFELPRIVDPSAIISPKSYIGEGTFIGKGVCINAGAQVGKCSIINTCAVIEHNNIVGNFTHIATGSILCGDVQIGNHVIVGANSTIIQGIIVGSNTIIGAGSTVLHNVSDNTTVYGVV